MVTLGENKIYKKILQTSFCDDSSRFEQHFFGEKNSTILRKLFEVEYLKNVGVISDIV